MTMIPLPDGTALRLVDDGQGLTVLVSDGVPPASVEQAGETAWYVPYTRVHPDTVAGAPRDATWVDVSSSPVAYFGLLHELWARGGSFALLEHDVVCRPDVVRAFEECPEPWCVYGYSNICCRGCMEAWRNALGCTRFRAEALRAVPDAVLSIPADNWDWHNVCDGLGNNLRAAGFTHHWHEPWVFHHQMGRHDQLPASFAISATKENL